MANSDVTIVVAASVLNLWLKQRRVGRTLVQMITRDLHHGTAAG